MSLYERPYHILFYAITNAVEKLPEGEVRRSLIEAQQRCEEIYIEEAEEPEEKEK